MSDLLREWLGKSIEKELGAVLEWRGQNDANRKQLSGKIGNLSFDDDGSNLRVKAPQPQIVQICKYVSSEPTQLSLSDTLNRVNATIAKEAVLRYEKKKKKRLTEGTIGGLIQLTDFEIVATHIGSRQKRITLFVTDFKTLGSNGSGEFGVPRAIEDHVGTQRLIQSLNDFRVRESPNKALKGFFTESQSDNLSSQPASFQDSQTFATQAPFSTLPAFDIRKSDPKHSHNGHGSNSPSAEESPELEDTLEVLGSNNVQDSTNGQTGKRYLHPSHISNKSKHPMTHEHKTSSAANDDLLSLLHPQGLTSTTASNLRDARSAHQSTLHPRLENKETITNAVKSKARPILNFSLSHGKISNAEESSVTTFGASDSRRSISDHMTDNINLRYSNARKPISNHAHDRIRRRDVKIPRDQEDLLNGDDSWLPAEPGRREPAANVPISLLDNWNRKAHSKAQRKERRLSGNQKDSIEGLSQSTSHDVDVDKVESESDILISSGQWPPSPDPDEPPPDSPMQVTDMAVNSDLKTRSPAASTLSQSFRSRTPSPLRVTWTTETVAPHPIDNSSSIVSSSAGEEAQRFRCHVPECKKSYKNSGGLKYHLDRHHQNKGQTRSFNCEHGDCRKSYSTPSGLKYHIQHGHERKLSGPLGSISPSHSSAPAVSSAPVSDPDDLNPEKSHGDLAVSINGMSSSHTDLEDTSGSALREESRVNGHTSSAHSLNLSVQPVIAAAANISAALASDESSITIPQMTNYNDLLRSNRMDPASTVSSESDLEVTVPIPLTNAKGLRDSSPSLQDRPHNSSPKEPFTQVKRTPYMDGHFQRMPGSEFDREISQTSPSKSAQLPVQSISEDIDHVTQSAPFMEGTSHLEAIESRAGNTPKEEESTNDSETTIDNANKLSPLVMLESDKYQVHDIMTSQAQQRPENDAMSINGLSRPVRGPESPIIPQKPKANLQGNSDPETKRKVPPNTLLSPNVTKRRKRFKVPSTFDFAESNEERPDPMEGARRYREEFLASRTSSEASTPMVSPKVAHAGAGSTQSIPKLGVVETRIIQGDPGVKKTQRSPKDEHMPSPASPPTSKAAVHEPIGVKFGPSGQTPRMLPFQVVSEEVTKVGQASDLHTESHGSELYQPNPSRLSHGQSETADISTDSKPNGQDKFVGSGLDDNAHSGAKETFPEQQDDETSQVEAQEIPHSRTVVCEDLMEISDPTSPYSNASEQTMESVAPADVSNNRVPSDLDEAYKSLPMAGLEKPQVGTSEENLPPMDQGNVPIFNRSISRELIPRTISPQLSSPSYSPPTPTSERNLPSQTQIRLLNGTSSPSTAARQGELEKSNFVATAPPIKYREGQTITRAEDSAMEPDTGMARGAVGTGNNLAKDTVKYPLHTTPKALSRPSFPGSQIEPAPLQERQTIFDRFKSAYPSYAGDKRHFVAICKKITNLMKSMRMEHPSLWDDFIVRHKTDYPEYLRKCLEDAEDALQYEDFYRSEIEHPIYQLRMVTPKNLANVLSLTEPTMDTAIPSHKPLLQKVSPPDMKHFISPAKPPTSERGYDKSIDDTPGCRVTIDLTLDEDGIKSEASESRKELDFDTPSKNKAMRNSNGKGRRSLPWTKADNDGDLIVSPDQELQRNSGSLVSKTAKRKKISMGESVHEPLDLDCQVKSVHAREPNSIRSAGAQTKAQQPHFEEENNTAKIESAWGTTVNEIVGWLGYRQALSKTQLKLLLAITDKVSPKDAKNLIQNQKSTHYKGNRNDEVQTLSGDLKAVLERLEEQNNRTVGEPKGSTSAVDRQAQGAQTVSTKTVSAQDDFQDSHHGDWWRDQNTPFRSFARAYKAIRPGSGNSFAKAESEHNQHDETHRRKRRPIDPLRWNL